MSTLHRPHGRADADTGKGELRKPQDDSSQPGQGEAEAEAGHEDSGPALSRTAREKKNAAEVGQSPREYGHSSGDRNTMRDPHDWHEFEGGIQRDATPGAPLDPDRRPDPRAPREKPSDSSSGGRS